MKGYNKVILVGHLGNDPETIHFDGGGQLTKASLATSETYTNRDGEKVTDTQWHNIVFRNKLSEIADKYLEKGNAILVEGKITTRSYEDRDGNKRYVTEINAQSMNMLGGKSDSERAASGANTAAPAKNGADYEPDDDDLPF